MQDAAASPDTCTSSSSLPLSFEPVCFHVRTESPLRLPPSHLCFSLPLFPPMFSMFRSCFQPSSVASSPSRSPYEAPSPCRLSRAAATRFSKEPASTRVPKAGKSQGKSPTILLRIGAVPMLTPIASNRPSNLTPNRKCQRAFILKTTRALIDNDLGEFAEHSGTKAGTNEDSW